VAKFTSQTVERVKEAADIIEIVSAYTELRRAGERHMGLCPFHEERTPSFSVDPREKLYHCFGCGVGGDVIKFVEEKEGLGFPEAVEALADRYGVGWSATRRIRGPRMLGDGGRGSVSCWSERRSSTPPACGSRRRPGRRASTWSLGAWARRSCGRSGWVMRRAPGIEC
jgi:hypothetical protein